MAVKISVTASHDGANIQFPNASPADARSIVVAVPPTATSGRTAKCTVSLLVRPDVFTSLEDMAHMQYFSFRVFVSGLHENDDDGEGVKLLTVTYEIVNAHAVSYPEAWPGTTVFYSPRSSAPTPSDDDAWRRNQTTRYVDGKLTWTHVHVTNGPVFFSYFPMYGYDRHLKLAADCAAAAANPSLAPYRPRVESLGQTLQGRELECISIGSGTTAAWIIHRQHPGETMAEFFAEGLLHRLLGIAPSSELDEPTRRVLQSYRLRIVPNMCPDGSVLGHLRTNSVGANLNREWATVRPDYVAPSADRSPEVLAVLSAMDRTGVDFFLDVHGDEELPYVFFSGAEKTPIWSNDSPDGTGGERIRRLHGYFVSCYQKINPDVQKEIGYPPPDSEEIANAHMNVATNQISNRFDCLGLTLEMPFKDCATNPDPERGFDIRRAKRLGADLVEALEGIRPFLRAEGEFWKGVFGEEDEYVVPTDNFKEEGFVMLKKRFYSDVRPHDA
ncbi:hypothetical protein ACHAXS_012177 [Conticribra weissflogii]